MMSSPHTIPHAVTHGETLRIIAERYGVSVEVIREQNPGRIYIGDVIHIHGVRMPEAPMMPVHAETHMPCACRDKLRLAQDMRMVWEQHIMWTRMVILSVFDELRGGDSAGARLSQTAGQIAAQFRPFFGDSVASEIERLFAEHIDIGGKLLNAMKQGDRALTAQLNSQWYMNADEIAAYLASISEFFDHATIQSMMHEHLDTTKREVDARIRGDYTADVAAYGEVERLVLEMADMFTEGIVRQFPHAFR